MHAINGKIRKSKEQYYTYIVTSSVLKRKGKKNRWRNSLSLRLPATRFSWFCRHCTELL